MKREYSIEAYAIVSANGMIANAEGQMPPELQNKADQRFFYAGLDRAYALVHGRNSHERRSNSRGRRRLVLTRKVAALTPDPDNPKVLFWNPAATPFDEARIALGLHRGMLAVIGGTEVYDLFFTVGYDAFHLSRADRVTLPNGRPVFPGVGARTPEDILKGHSLHPGPLVPLDPAAGVSLTTWSADSDACVLANTL